MSRPIKLKQLEKAPKPVVYMPAGWTGHNVPAAEIAVEDFEALRLVDGQGCTLDEVARRIKVSRSTAGRMLERARRILAKALSAQAPICIDAGENSNFTSSKCEFGPIGELAAAVEADAADAPLARIFGRAPFFAIYQREAQQLEIIRNPGLNLKRGAAQAAVKVLSGAGVRRVAAGRFGSEALQALAKAGIEPLLLNGLQLKHFEELYRHQ